ncbi:unnamed protein product [Mesocestoides corti]|uniref:Protein kinase domain-containing protein n=1 Tax=Mesocestoides corti TaxID=53468 RepID=A0A0R3UDD9_MESCO|nr:unnamed protein product [Mesocestoides corti]
MRQEELRMKWRLPSTRTRAEYYGEKTSVYEMTTHLLLGVAAPEIRLENGATHRAIAAKRVLSTDQDDGHQVSVVGTRRWCSCSHFHLRIRRGGGGGFGERPHPGTALRRRAWRPDGSRSSRRASSFALMEVKRLLASHPLTHPSTGYDDTHVRYTFTAAALADRGVGMSGSTVHLDWKGDLLM